MMSSNPFRWTDPSTWPWIVYVWLALILVGWLKPAWRWMHRQRTSSWPTASGQIEYASVTENWLIEAAAFYPVTSKKS